MKTEIINYLEKTARHTFAKPELKYIDGKYEPDYSDYKLFKVFKREDNYYYLVENSIRKIDIDFFIKYYGKNAKNVIKTSLFLNKKMKSITNTRIVRERIDKLLNVE